ncbi:hypothetical protein [Blastomonas aquatica]|uniref:Uncharacterized protein n=1 Tax=Blastomonas aquatica TaxID=1510276 RepID=A0ABQ1JP46_9SPHN|nr:hypothetical protein [Blastomonas aquatica]GGB74005.1 hypothetical protein GCM10010833_31550 [Blastomonas aquatica]
MAYLQTAILAMVLVSAAASDAGTAAPASASAPATTGLIFVPPVADDAVGPVRPEVDCIMASRVQSTRIVEGVGIVYKMAGRRRLLNRPRHGVRQLQQHQVLITRLRGAYLCAGDIVQLAGGMSGIATGSIALGRFEAYQPTAAD